LSLDVVAKNEMENMIYSSNRTQSLLMDAKVIKASKYGNMSLNCD
jgi:hypothetical protein